MMHFIYNLQLSLTLYTFQLSRNSACPSAVLITTVSIMNIWSIAVYPV